MDSNLQGRMINIMNEALDWASARENQLRAQVLDLQRRINKIHDTKPIVRKRQAKQQVKQEIKQQNIAASFQKKIQQMISKAEQQIQQIDNPSYKKTKQSQVTKNTKFVQPLPQIQKKPPIPTVNRSKDPQLVTHKPNYHYRNKNQVTGKITQTPHTKASNSKIGSSNSLKKQQTKNIFHQSAQKQINNKKVIEKVTEKMSEKVIVKNQMNSNPKQSRKQVNSADTKLDKTKVQKIVYVDFCTFHQPIQSLVSKARQKQGKKVGNKRQIIQNLIAECNKNQLGYKQNQNKAMNGFLNSFNKLSASRTRLPLKTSLSIEPRVRQPHLQTFNFQNLLDHFQAILDANPISQQYSPDPKQVCKIKHWHKILNQIFEDEIMATRQNLKLPPTLGIDFQMNTNNQDNTQTIDNSEEHAVNPYLPQFYQVLSEQLQELKSLQNFDKETLKKLRLLIVIGVYEGKRSPVLIQTDKYEEWKQYYLTDE